jgi:hypothetical protein
MGAILFVLYIGDHPLLFAGYRTEVLTLDVAYTNEAALIEYLGILLNAKIHRVTVRKVDLVNTSTSVEVRFELPTSNRVASDSRTSLDAVGVER